MSRLNKAEEIIELAIMFQNSYCGLCIDDIQEHFECSRRSAERMKALLFDLFPEKIELVPTSDKKKRWRFIKGTMNSLISFTSNDFANLEYLKGLSNDENKQKELDELIAKIKALTPQKNTLSLETDIEAILESQGFAVRQYSRIKVDKSVLDKLRLAMLSFKRIEFDYNTDKGLRHITLNPYGIIISDKYYLVGYNNYVNDLRLYKTDKIQNLVVTNEYFIKDENFSLSQYCNNSFSIYQEEPAKITLEFDSKVVQDVLNYHFHPTQKMETLKSGNIQVKFTSGGKLAICHELFKWGINVKIKKPTWLKEYYKDYLENILKNI